MKEPENTHTKDTLLWLHEGQPGSPRQDQYRRFRHWKARKVWLFFERWRRSEIRLWQFLKPQATSSVSHPVRLYSNNNAPCSKGSTWLFGGGRQAGASPCGASSRTAPDPGASRGASLLTQQTVEEVCQDSFACGSSFKTNKQRFRTDSIFPYYYKLLRLSSAHTQSNRKDRFLVLILFTIVVFMSDLCVCVWGGCGSTLYMWRPETTRGAGFCPSHSRVRGLYSGDWAWTASIKLAKPSYQSKSSIFKRPRIFFILFILLYNNMYVRRCVHMNHRCVGIHRGQKRSEEVRSPGLAVTYGWAVMWVLGTAPRSSAKAASTLNHWSICTALGQK